MDKYIKFAAHILILPLDLVTALVAGVGAFFRTTAAHISVCVGHALSVLHKSESAPTEQKTEIHG